MATADESSDQDQFKSILFQAIQNKLAGKPFHDTILLTLQEIMDDAQQVIEQLESSGQSPPVFCRSGCHYCCHSRVNILPLEALLIFSYIEHHFTHRAVFGLKTKISQNFLLTDKKTLQERVLGRENTPCIFLKAGECSIYPARPFICRSWNSLDKFSCKAAYESGSHAAEIESSTARNYVFSTARDLFRDLSRHMKMDADLLVMPRAIEQCLCHADPLAQWVGGNPIFSNHQG